MIRHLLDNTLCADAYNSNIPTILEVSNCKLQLSALEEFYITKHQSILSKLKKFYDLLLFNPTDYTITKPDLVKEENKRKLANPTDYTITKPDLVKEENKS